MRTMKKKWCPYCGERITGQPGERCPECEQDPHRPGGHQVDVNSREYIAGKKAKAAYYGGHLVPPSPKPKPTLSFFNLAQIRSEVRHVPLHVAMNDLARERPELYEVHQQASQKLAALEDSLRRQASIAAGLARLTREQRARVDAHERRRAHEDAEEQRRRQACGRANARREARGKR